MQSNSINNNSLISTHSYNEIQYEEAHPLPDLSDMLLSNETLCAMVDNSTPGGAVCQVMGPCDVNYTALLQDNNNEHSYNDMTSFATMNPILQHIDSTHHVTDSEAEEKFLHQFNLSKNNSKIISPKEVSFKVTPFTRSNLKFKTKIGASKRNEQNNEKKTNSLPNVSELKEPISKNEKAKPKKRKIVEKPQACQVPSKTLKILKKDGGNTVLPVNEVAGLCAVCCVAYTSTEEQKSHLSDPEHIIKVEAKKGTDHKALKDEQKFFEKMKMPTKCQHCFKQIKLKNELYIHHRRHTNLQPFSCTKCSMRFYRSGDLLSHLRNHTGHHSFQCTVCMKRMASKAKLESHLIAKHGHQDTRSRNFKCTECNEAFMSKHEVNRHMNSHTGYRPIKCFVCGHGFTSNHALTVHQRMHSGEKPYECTICKFQTRSQQLLMRHNRTHTGEKPFKCTICDYCSVSSAGLKRHLMIHAGTKPYKCPYCKYRSSNIENLRKHVKQTKKHDGLKVYPCPHCDFSSDDRFVFVKHIKQSHLPYLDEENESAAKLSGILMTDEQIDEEQSDDVAASSSQTKDKMLSQSAEKDPPLCELDSTISDKRETNLYDSITENSDYNVPHQALSFEIQQDNLPDKHSEHYYGQQQRESTKNNMNFEVRQQNNYRIPQISSMYNPQQQKIAPSVVVKNKNNIQDFNTRKELLAVAGKTIEKNAKQQQENVTTDEQQQQEKNIKQRENCQKPPTSVSVEKLQHNSKTYKQQQQEKNSYTDKQKEINTHSLSQAETNTEESLNAELLNALIKIPNLQKVILPQGNGNGPVTLVIGGASSNEQPIEDNDVQNADNTKTQQDNASSNQEDCVQKPENNKNLEEQKHYHYVISSGGIHLYPT